MGYAIEIRLSDKEIQLSKATLQRVNRYAIVFSLQGLKCTCFNDNSCTFNIS